MNSIWRIAYDRFKDRRYGALFLVSILTLVTVLSLGCLAIRLLDSPDARRYMPVCLAPAGVFLVAWAANRLRRRLMHRPLQQDFSPLSDDEKRVARSKLVKSTKAAGL